MAPVRLMERWRHPRVLDNQLQVGLLPEACVLRLVGCLEWVPEFLIFFPLCFAAENCHQFFNRATECVCWLVVTVDSHICPCDMVDFTCHVGQSEVGVRLPPMWNVTLSFYNLIMADKISALAMPCGTAGDKEYPGIHFRFGVECVSR